MRRLHLIVGLAAVLAFVLTGQMMHFHKPKLGALQDDVHLMFVSRHIYLAGAALVNVCLGLYLRMQKVPWRRAFQMLGSIVVLLSPVFLLLAFLHEPALGIAGRSWRSQLGVIPLVIGVALHFVASIGANGSQCRIDSFERHP